MVQNCKSTCLDLCGLILIEIPKQRGSTAMAGDVPSQAVPAPPPTTTTLCLWEPDPELMIRRAQGQERARKSEYAAEARKGAFTEQAIETGSSIAIREFESNFAVELRAAQETMTQVEDVEVADAETPNLLDWWQTQLKELHNTVSGAASFLPTATREKLVGQIVSQEALLREQRDRLAPKKKFGFKNRSKVGTSKTTAPADAAVTPAAPPAAAPLPKADTFQAPAGCQGFRGHSGQTLIRDAGEGSASDFALEQLVGCEVRLLTTSTALWIRGLKQCTVFAVPVGGSIYVTECEECTLYLGSRQLRMHTSTKVAFYIHTSSHPIIEHCTGLTFAPYPSPLPITLAGAFADAALKPEQNQWCARSGAPAVIGARLCLPSLAPCWCARVCSQGARRRL